MKTGRRFLATTMGARPVRHMRSDCISITTVTLTLGLGWGGVDVVRIVVVAYIHSSMKGGKDGEREWWID